MDDAANLIGVWHLTSYTARAEDGTLLEPLGPDPVGIGVYTAEGYVSAQLSRASRTRFEESSPHVGPHADVRVGFEAFAGYVAYCGRYVVDVTQRRVEHHVVCSLSPNWEREVLSRTYELQGDSLILRPPPRLGATGLETLELRWRREPRAS